MCLMFSLRNWMTYVTRTIGHNQHIIYRQQRVTCHIDCNHVSTNFADNFFPVFIVVASMWFFWKGMAEGGFRANITVKGVDFKCSGGSDLHSIPRLARESAASQLLAKLCSMAVQS
ncbi:hypothetical protein RHMOL_Rhmol02G0086300 [Rhododendron molle]|uniref:Uncharacterized protein n=1 Tax=Rhododendron molle TaxID=49168 RepID=A0ACC0PPD4_RHOML|nr:hypothetical protein RHMOL_Rhmol02G0086300 [Rhododendron molle]